MDANSVIKEDKTIHDLTDAYQEPNNGNNQEVIVIDGRGYENNDQGKKDIYTLVDIIDDSQTGDKIYEDIIKRAERIVENIASKMIPEIAERIIREEIEKIKKNGSAE
ncbi:MAG: hypothetical protein WC373_00225 [Smithella sp.]|jgi:hypothetical protein